ncbi:DUF4251 domain-containing protein [Psychroserpens algicola]|uniref:DUF4251 domain-containing protein n=1 Tax=Psychroserpens algicola TaxID=1719034 RepID=A0ABT0HAJ7_9FLAO|nr:DUF4251 domain-containing protein [Psychroserpens algicola]MCK8481393.1 DUF4251 domain-containing protein [Psychroserpens algicola]
MKTRIIILSFVSLFVMTCSASKTNATPEQIAALDQLVANQTFKIESHWAMPQVNRSISALQNSGIIAPGSNANRISLTGIANELKLDGETISSRLPYYGEVQMPSGYNGSDDNNISFDGTIKNYKAEKNDNSSYTISFDAKSNNEGYNVTIILYPSLKSDMILKGAKRFPIRYTGQITPISE